MDKRNDLALRGPSIFDRIARDIERDLGPYKSLLYNPISLMTTRDFFNEGDVRFAMNDVYEKDNKIVAEFELPGVDKKDINLNIYEGSLEVSVNTESKKEDKEKKLYESTKRQFYSAVSLPKGIETDKIDASYKDGILKVEIPKSGKAIEQKKKIEIK